MPTNTEVNTAPAGSGQAKVRVRMYRQGLGDCFLVTFFTGPAPVHMLIDCGTLGATTTGVKMPEVIQNIHDTTGGHIHILVGTHEHHDHVSGFGGKPSPFDKFEVDHSWVAWTEDPEDLLAIKISKYKHDLVESLRLAVNALQDNPPKDAVEKEATGKVCSGMRELLGFFGDLPAAGQMLPATLATGVNDAMTYVTNRGKERHFLNPGTVIEQAALPGVRFYILGPPKVESALRNMGEHGSPELYSMSDQLCRDLAVWSDFALSGRSFPAQFAALDALERQQFEAQLPFDPQFRLEASETRQCQTWYPEYFKETEAWRRIDVDWLVGGSELALQLDSYTNNTSLAFAIELVDDGRVLLFPADAQVGNWLSWAGYTFTVKDGAGTKEVAVGDLLARTALYKVGHHSSHNATIKAGGLELMTRDDLVALIPVDHVVAVRKTPPWIMPADALYKRLIEKTKGRVVRSDTGWPKDTMRPASITPEEWAADRAAAPITFSEPVLYIDYELA